MGAKTVSQDAEQKIAMAAAHALSQADLKTSGQRILCYVEELAKSGILHDASRPNLALTGAVFSKHDALGGSRRDVMGVIRLCRAADTDANAKNFVERLRSGETKDGITAYNSWNMRKSRACRARLRPDGQEEAENQEAESQKGADGSASNIDPKALSNDNLDWIATKAREIRDSTESPAMRSYVMAKALAERGLVSLKIHGIGMTTEVRELIAKEMSISGNEVTLGLTFLRKLEAEKMLPGVVEAIESGQYRSLEWPVSHLTKGSGRKFAEVVVDKRTLRREARQALRNGRYLTPSNRSLAYLESMVKLHVLDPASRQSRQSTAVYNVAIKVIKVSRDEIEACWALMRAVERKELPSTVLDTVRLGVSTARHVVEGGLAALIREHRRRKRHGVEAVSLAEIASTTDICVAEPMSDMPVKERSEDLARDLQSMTARFGVELNSIIAVAEDDNDKELLAIAKLVRDQIGLLKTRALSLVNRRSARSVKR